LIFDLEVPLAAIDEAEIKLEKATTMIQTTDGQTEANSDSEQTGACHKFNETEMERFKRIGDYFNPEQPEKMLINPKEILSTSDLLN